MPRPSSSRGQVHPLVALALAAIAVAALVAAVALAPRAGSQAPAAPASHAPVATPRPTLAPASPTPAPSQGTGAPAVIRIPLDIADDHDVVVALRDPDGHVREARSGRAADGMSVGWHDAEVVQTGPDTIRLTWVGLGFDDQVDVAVGRSKAAVSIQIAQAAPPPNADTLGYDRVLILSFDQPIDSGSVTTHVLDRAAD